MKMKILETVKNCTRIGIAGHENPDGDCAGACCGLALYLRKAMPEAQVDVYLESLEEALQSNIPGAETALHEIPEKTERYDAFVLLDCMPGRIGVAGELYENASLKVNIDHHKTNPGCGDIFYVDGKASSACELVWHTLDESLVDADIARALYVGIVTDTGVFQYSNTGESTMRLAGKLIGYGFDFTALIREVFFERTPKQARVLGTALIKAEPLLDGKLILCCFDKKTMDELGAGRKDLDGISAQLLLTEGADCSVFFHETEPGIWRASMRSLHVTDVSSIAAKHEGGGHLRAAGFTIRTDIHTAIKDITDDIAQQLRRAHVI